MFRSVNYPDTAKLRIGMIDKQSSSRPSSANIQNADVLLRYLIVTPSVVFIIYRFTIGAWSFPVVDKLFYSGYSFATVVCYSFAIWRLIKRRPLNFLGVGLSLFLLVLVFDSAVHVVNRTEDLMQGCSRYTTPDSGDWTTFATVRICTEEQANSFDPYGHAWPY